MRRVFILMGLFTGVVSVALAQDESIHLTLKEALQSVDTINLQVLMANARLEQAIASIAQSRADLLPHLDGTVNGSRQTTDLRSEGIVFPIPGFGPHIGPYNTFDARGQVTMSLFDPAAFERFEAARKGEKLSEADLQKTREDILALVANLFLDAKRKAQTVQLLEAILDRDQMAYALNETNLNQGTGTQLDSSKGKADLDQTKYLLSEAKLQAQNAFLDLEAALQLPLNKPLILDDDNDFIQALQIQAKAAFNDVPNADVMEATSQLAAKEANKKEAYADFLPKISGTANYGRAGESPQQGSNTYFVGLQASVPIWDGGSQQANLKEANGEVKEAQESLQDASQQEQVNIAKAQVEITEADDLRTAKAQQQQTAEKSWMIAQHAKDIGTGTALAVLQAKADLASAEDDYNEAQVTWILAYIDLLHAEGRLRDLIKQGDET